MTKPTIITALPNRREAARSGDRRLTVVAGGAGFIGSHLCRALLDRGEAVLCLDNLQTARPSNLPGLQADPNFTFVRCDIANPLPAEVLAMAPLTLDPQYTVNPSWKDMAVACGGLAGQTLVVCMGLGLAWEWWLARAAALKWSQVRNFRRLSSITVPLGTALVAAATAFATVVAGAWAQQELQPPSGSPSSAPIAPAQPGQPAR